MSSTLTALPNGQLNDSLARASSQTRSSDENASPRVAHTLTACTRCRQRKTRCDPGLPRCGPCERTNAVCEYWDPSKRCNIKRDYVVWLQHRVNDLEKELDRIENEDVTEDPELMMRNAASVKLQDTVETKFLGPSSGTQITRLVMQLAKQFTDAKTIKDIVPDSEARRVQDIIVNEDKPTSKVYPLISSVAAEDLPNEELTHLLYRLYCLKVQPMYPALHEPSLLQDIKATLKGTTDPYQNFITRMMVAISLQKMDTQYAGLADSYYLAALKYMEDVVKAMDLKTLQAFALIAEYSLTTPTRTAIYYVVGLAVRLVQALGIHEEATITRGEGGRMADPLETDMRRRLFWCIFAMEGGLSHALGRPMALASGREHFDVQFFALCDDSQITREGIVPGARPVLKKWIAMHFFKMRLLQLEIRRTLYLRKRLTPKDDQDPWFKEILAKMDSWRDTSPEENEGMGLDKVWFIGRYNTMIAFLYRPSPQIPKPSLLGAMNCFDAAKYNIYMTKEQINRKTVDLTWIFTQAIFMAINTMLWSLSYERVRRLNPRHEVEAHLAVGMESILKAADRWPGVLSAHSLYQHIIKAILAIYEKDGDIPISTGTPSDVPSPLTASLDGHTRSSTNSPATTSQSHPTPPEHTVHPGYFHHPGKRTFGHPVSMGQALATPPITSPPAQIPTSNPHIFSAQSQAGPDHLQTSSRPSSQDTYVSPTSQFQPLPTDFENIAHSWHQQQSQQAQNPHVRPGPGGLHPFNSNSASAFTSPTSPSPYTPLQPQSAQSAASGNSFDFAWHQPEVAQPSLHHQANAYLDPSYWTQPIMNGQNNSNIPQYTNLPSQPAPPGYMSQQDQSQQWALNQMQQHELMQNLYEKGMGDIETMIAGAEKFFHDQQQRAMAMTQVPPPQQQRHHVTTTSPTHPRSPRQETPRRPDEASKRHDKTIVTSAPNSISSLPTGAAPKYYTPSLFADQSEALFFTAPEARKAGSLLFGDESSEGQLSPTVAKQLRGGLGVPIQGFGLFGENEDFLTQARGVPQADKSPPKPPRSEAAMLSSRWAPTPDRELHEKGEAIRVPSAETPKRVAASETPQKPLPAPPVDSPRPKQTEAPSRDTPRKKKRILWNGRQCIISLPSSSPEHFGRPQPLSRIEVDDIFTSWEDKGFDTDRIGPADEAGSRENVQYHSAQSLYAKIGSKAAVRIPDPKAWQAYVDWLVEEKLRALGVGGPDEPMPASSREVSGQQQSRTFSPTFNASITGSQGHPLSQRSTPALSNFSTGPHSRSMSIASPLSSATDNRGHAHRHSVFGMPQQFQQSIPGVSPSIRPYSPSQQLSLNAIARATSPAIDRLKGSISPGMRSGSSIEGQPFRPSPVSADRLTPPSHGRHQSLAPSFSPQQTLQASTPQPLAGVPEDEEDTMQHRTPRAAEIPREIFVPTPRGHRHNISEGLEKEIRVAELMLEKQAADEAWQQQQQAHGSSSIKSETPPPNPALAASFRPFAGNSSIQPAGSSFGQSVTPTADSFSFQPNMQPFRPTFGSPAFQPQQPPPGFQPQPQMPFGQGSFNPGRPAFQPRVSSFEFQPASVRPPSGFQPGSLVDMFPAVPDSRPNPSGNHARQESSGNLNVTAPAFKPQSSAFGFPGSNSNFDFSSSFEFKPGASSFEPSKQQTNEQKQQKPIFGQVSIPEVVKPPPQSKAVAIVRPTSQRQDTAVEDEFGRLTASADRQKRAFRSSGDDDGDSVPLFAQRPDSPIKATSEREAIDDDQNVGDVGEVETSEMDLDDSANADASLTKTDSHAREYSTDENKENAPVQKSTFGRPNLHARQPSSLSALAKPFRFGPPSPEPDQGLPLQMPSDIEALVELPSVASPPKPSPDLGRIFSRGDVTIDGELDKDEEPEEPLSQDTFNATTPALASEPSFDEIDAVMRQLNEDVDAGEEITGVRATIETDPLPVESRVLGPTSPATPGSVQVHPIPPVLSRSVSPISAATRLEMPSNPVEGAITASAQPSSEWSADYSPGAEQHIRRRSGFFDDRVDEVIGKAFKQHLQPLQDQVDSLQRSLSEVRPRTADSRFKPVSSALESDADDEDDVIDERFLTRSNSRPRSRKADTIKAAVLEALASQRSHSPASIDFADLLNGFEMVNSRLDTLLTRGFDLDDVRDVIQDTLHKSSSSLVHIPRAASTDSERDEFAARKLLKLAEEELAALRATVVDKDNKLDKADRERRTWLDRVDDLEESEARQRRRANDLEAENAAQNATLEEYRALRTKLLNEQDDAEHRNSRLRSSLEDAEARISDLLRENEDAKSDNELLRGSIEDLGARSLVLAEEKIAVEELGNQLRRSLADSHGQVADLLRDKEAYEEREQFLRASLAELEGQLADGGNIRENMREKLDRIHKDMASAATQLASQKALWQRQNEDSQRRLVVMQAQLQSEADLRASQDGEIARLRMLVSEGEAAKTQLGQALSSNGILEDSLQSLRDEINEQQTSNSRIHRELQDARGNSRIEIQRAELMMQAGIEAAHSQADASKAGLESKLSITENELDNMKALMEAMKQRHEVLLQEEADLRRATLSKVNEASNTALEQLRARHDEDVHFIRTQHERKLADAKQDKDRAEAFWNERLSMSDARHEHLKERISHLEGRLTIAKSAAQAAASAAANANKPAPTNIRSEPERISPQALRETILVLQEQVQERESRLERLQTEHTALQREHPHKLREKDAEISWLRELLAVRSDDLTELISTLDSSDFNVDAARDAAIRIQTGLKLEIAEKERHIAAGNSVAGQVIAGVTNFASPKAVQLAAAIGSWRARGAPSRPTPTPRRVESPASGNVRQLERVRRESSQTPSKRPSSSGSWMSGLMTPPASGLRRTPSPGAVTAAEKGKGVEMLRRDSRFDEGPATPGDTPVSLRRQSFDEDAGDVGGLEEFMEGGEGRSLARELEPIG